MTDFINDFIEFASQKGLAPASSKDIVPDNKRRNYRLWDDPPKKKRGYYKLEIDGDFAYGFCGDYRSDVCHSWHAHTKTKPLTKKERDNLKVLAEKRKRAHERQRLKGHEAAAEKALDEYMFHTSKVKADHPYLVKKNIQPYGLEMSGQNLFIPMYDGDGKMWNRQIILPNGKKLFLGGGRKQGTFFKIEGKEDIVFVCEGFATGASVHEATGCTVYVAFDAGNLSSALEEILKSRKNAQKCAIIIAGDNDRETVINGKPHNTGLLKGLEAAKKHDIRFIMPDLNDDDQGIADFNDIHVKYGVEYLKNMMENLVTSPPDYGSPSPKPNEIDRIKSHEAEKGGHPQSKVPDDWVGQLTTDKNGRIKKTDPNLKRIMIYDESILGAYRYNSFDKNIFVMFQPPTEEEDGFSPRKLQDNDYFPLQVYIAEAWGISISKNTAADLIEYASKRRENTFNPAKDYFESLEWDGVSRIDSWLWDYVSDHRQDEHYVRMVGRKFLCGMAARAMQPGVKFDTMLILEGRQYAGKSRLCRILATIKGEEYFLDDFRDIDNKDALMKMQGKLIVEFPEISTLRKNEVNDLKAFLSREEDVYRAPYGRNTLTAPRQCVFIGTVNPEGPYFKDMTGNRRYWPVSCRHSLRLEGLSEITHQLHAEAAHLVKSKEQLWLTEEEYDEAKVEQKKRTSVDPWTGDIENFVLRRTRVSSKELCEVVGVPIEKRNTYIYQRISQIMSHLGFENGQYKEHGRSIRGYLRREMND